MGQPAFHVQQAVLNAQNCLINVQNALQINIYMKINVLLIAQLLLLEVFVPISVQKVNTFWEKLVDLVLRNAGHVHLHQLVLAARGLC